MKKNIFLTLAMLMVSALSFAQTELGNPKFYTVPAVFYPTDEVSIYFDMTDVGFKEGEDLYWWVWQPTEPDAGNWENSSDFAKLEYLGDNLYRKKIVPVDYFFQNQDRFATKEAFLEFMEGDWGEAGFWSRLKTKDGQIQSGVFCVEHNRPEIADFASSGKEYQIFSGQKGLYTEKWTMDKPLSILFNGDLVKIGGKTLNEWSKEGKGIFTHAGVHGFYTDADDNVIEYDFKDAPEKNINQQYNVWRQGCVEKVGLKNIGSGVWRWDVTIPQEYFAYNPVNADEGGNDAGDGTYYYLTDMGMVGADGNWAVNPDFASSFVANELKFGLVVQDWAASAWGFEFKAGTAEAYPDPSFSYFPSKVSVLDIVTFIRQFNGRTDGDLTWTIEADGKTFSGTMTGNRDRRQGSANLLSQLAGSAATSIKVTVTNAKGAVVAETEIPLVSVDE